MATEPSRINPDVLGIMFGPLDRYLQLSELDENTLYFIKDKGLIFRGKTLVTPINVVEASTTGTGAQQQTTFTLTYYGEDPSHPTVQTITVFTASAISAILTTINTNINNHKTAVATYARLGHVKLSDAVNDTVHDADYGETHDEAYAATPAAVAAAISEANDYTDAAIASISSGMTIKGSYGTIDDGADETRALDLIDADDGDTYICISTMATVSYHNAEGQSVTTNLAPGDYIICLQAAEMEGTTITSAARWTIIPNPVQNSVTTEDAQTVLTENALVVGAGNKKVKKLNPGTQGYYLRQGPTGPQWVNHVNADHGIGYGECEDTFETEQKTVEIPGFQHVEGAIIAVLFYSGVNAKDTLNVNRIEDLPIIYHNDFIQEGIITKGDTATLMFTKTNDFGLEEASHGAWVVISIDQPHDVPTQLSGFTNNIQGIGVCNVATGNTAKTATITGVTIGKGSVFAIRFMYDVDSSSTLNINLSGAKNILHRNAALGAGQIRGGDTVTFISDGISYHVLSIDRPFDQSPTENSHNLVDSNAIYQAIEAAKLKWQDF